MRVAARIGGLMILLCTFGLAMADDPAPLPKAELPGAKKKLAQLDAEIADKEKELSTLRTEADKLRQRIAATEGSKEKVYKKPEELFGDLPKSAYPKFGPAGGIERAAAKKWCKANLVGRRVEWTATIEEVSITDDGPFQVVIKLLLPFSADTLGIEGAPFGKTFMLGEQVCGVIIDPKNCSFIRFLKQSLIYFECTAQEADALRRLNRKEVVLQAPIIGVDVIDYVFILTDADGNRIVDRDSVPFVLTVSPPSINGVLPAASIIKSKDKK